MIVLDFTIPVLAALSTALVLALFAYADDEEWPAWIAAWLLAFCCAVIYPFALAAHEPSVPNWPAGFVGLAAYIDGLLIRAVRRRRAQRAALPRAIAGRTHGLRMRLRG